MSDKHFSGVGTLLRFDGVDGATAFTDSAGSPKVWTAAGNAQLDTAQKRFGTASLLLDGSGDQITTPDHADWLFTGQFCVEAWVRFSSLPAAETAIVAQYRASAAGRSWWLGTTSAGNLRAVLSLNGTAVTDLSLTSTPWQVNTWAHVAMTRDAADTVRLFCDGVEGASASLAGSLFDAAQLLRIGARLDGAGAAVAFWTGWIDELRVTKGAARYTANFLPPRGPFSLAKNLGVAGESAQPVIAMV